MSSIGAYPGLFEWGLLPPVLFDMGTLDVADVRFYVSLLRLCCREVIWCMSFYI